MWDVLLALLKEGQLEDFVADLEASEDEGGSSNRAQKHVMGTIRGAGRKERREREKEPQSVFFLM